MISIILVQPQMGENIGAAARAMKNFGINDLRIINPRDGWPNQQAIAMSVGAADIIDSARIYNNLEDSIADLHLVYATSCQVRDMNKAILSPSDAATQISQSANSEKQKVGIIFGRESSGLTNEEIMRADTIISIPTTDFSSLNLGQAICVICYEIFKETNKGTPAANHSLTDKDIDLASKHDKEYFYEQLFSALSEKNFFKTDAKSKTMQMKIRNIFERIGSLTSQELRTLRGIISNLMR